MGVWSIRTFPAPISKPQSSQKRARKMNERYVIPLRYDERLIQSAASGYVARALFRENALLTFAPLGMILLSCFMIYSSGDTETAIELLVVSLVILSIFLASGWRMHLRMLREKMHATRGRWPMARLFDEGISIEGSAQAGLLPWAGITKIWPIHNAWLLLTGANHYIVLPIGDASGEALEFLRGKVADARTPIGGVPQV